MEIYAAVAREKSSDFSLETLEIEAPRASEILVQVIATGICHTDLAVRDGKLPTPLPVVLGHEGAGIVTQVGADVTKVAPGDHVVMAFNFCGHCPSCEDNAPSYCYEFFPRNFFATRPDGSTALSNASGSIHANFFGQSSFATYAICHERNIVKVAPEAPLKLLGPLACGIQTGAGAVMNSLKVGAGKSFAVFGTGSVGLSAIMAAKVVDAKTIIAIDTNDTRLDLARELGATHIINPEKADTIDAIMANLPHGVDFALDTTGIPSVIRTAVESLAPRGTCGILGASGPDAEIVLNETHFMSAGRKLVGIVEGDSRPDSFIPTLIDLYLQGRFPFDKLVTFYPFENINQAVQDSATGTSIKPIVLMNHDPQS